MKDKEKLFSEAEVRNWCFQVFQGLAYMHQRGYFHRDLKPGTSLVFVSSIMHLIGFHRLSANIILNLTYFLRVF